MPEICKDLGITGMRPTRAVTGALLLAIPGEQGREKATALRARLDGALQVEGVRVACPQKQAELRVSGLSEAATQGAVREALATTGGCGATEVNRCTSTVDRSGLCYRCGEASHIARECTAAPKCPLCVGTGRPADHRMGGAACRPPKRKGKKGNRVGVPPSALPANSRPAPQSVATEVQGAACSQPSPAEVSGVVQTPASIAAAQKVVGGAPATQPVAEMMEVDVAPHDSAPSTSTKLEGVLPGGGSAKPPLLKAAQTPCAPEALMRGVMASYGGEDPGGENPQKSGRGGLEEAAAETS
ncbi:branchpoint-bridging protein-like [Colletes gigas]|uniref:branchpoint-bridging protein-like n=1 Tax=Colletes gigas TaxID=935657 RepID=UPI001C9A68EA|nr:branchpoint-bridging protein-like [Colletes gigas]